MLKSALALFLAATFSMASWGCALTGSTPPPTPHSGTGDYENCRSCHENGNGGAPVTSHAVKLDCLSCHPARP